MCGRDAALPTTHCGGRSSAALLTDKDKGQKKQNIMDFEKTIQLLSDITNSEMHHYGMEGVPFPSNDILCQTVNICRSLLFPGYYGASIIDPDSLRLQINVGIIALYNKLRQQIAAGLAFANPGEYGSRKLLWEEAKEKTCKFIEALPDLRATLSTDVTAHYRNDPAAHNLGEVILCYPGMKAISSYRIAHKLVELDVPLIPRVIAELAHSETGIDINPEARIGKGFAIDHGTGVVIGATCIIGDNVTLYQGVTLGARNFPQNDDGSLVKGIPRHPIIGDNVVVYSNATILGRITIGEGCVIGGNQWITQDLPPHTRYFRYCKRTDADKPAGH